MRSVALSAVYVSIMIFQLAKLTRAPNWFSSSKTASDARATRRGDSALSSGHATQLYWTPALRYPEVSDELNKHASGIFSLSPADHSPSTIELLAGHHSLAEPELTQVIDVCECNSYAPPH
ncbi:hypothetical protein PCANC_15891 [Puccinia coronata f. sp. avenae]|uniref:Secreted protein n=1 Tax=Puccinia coronata f. sp. avenae TaxID=200324 RepID=A0A2N5UAT8_9BASI|nr:hypothetical protein PCASD_15053 [Puccinia coronata f. sp. avenae]PLW38882.1 hypothetical protein PCANC_15891 [Puccinia coronata f. sp. avenae]